MNKSLNKRAGGIEGLLGQLAVEKKKCVMALGLISVMIFMWVKVLTSGGPSSAKASSVVEKADIEQGQQRLEVSYVELPQVEGRNNKISKDFFTVDNWQNFVSQQGLSASGVGFSEEGGGELAKVIGGKLKLQAIELGRKRLAFINDKLLAVGDKLVVSDGIEKYECEVVEIESGKVLIRCGKAEIVLKLSHQIEPAG